MITQKKNIVQFIEYFSQILTHSEKQRLLSKIDLHIDNKGTLYLRLDKQEVFLRNIKLGQTDPIKIKINFHKRQIFNGIINTLHSLNLL